MRIGVFSHGWWQAACEALGHTCLELPVATGDDGNPHSADLGKRLDNARAAAEVFAQSPPELLLDNGGTGLMLVPGSAGSESDLRLLHEQLQRPLLSHFIDPFVVAFQGLDWSVVWQSLQSPSWVKMIWDKAQVNELRSFGVQNVIHLPMAAPNREYDTSPVDPGRVRSNVSFVGGQNSRYFTHNDPTPPGKLFGGTLAMSVRSDLPDTLYYDIYHNLYGLGKPIEPSDSHETRIDKARAYFNTKLFYNAALCLKNRDRFVVFLKRVFGDTFDLVGRGWDAAYGLAARPPFPSLEDYFRHFRETAVNINLVTGNAETGLNMRHFEITAAGGFMLCYHQPELAEHFVIGKECDVFHSEHELIEKVRYYLTHPDERAAIARAGQKRTLAQNLYSHRLQTVLRLTSIRPPPVEFAQSTWSQDMKRLLPNADVILDCGANTGQMARGFRGLYPNARIYSFEPVTRCFGDLEKTCVQIGAQAVKKAVSDRDGIANINLTTSPECNSLLGYEHNNPCDKYTWIVDEEQVETCSLDSWCSQNDIAPASVDIIKLDIQGAELQALCGAPRILKEAKMVLTEVSFVRLYKDSPLFEDVDAFMTEAGFRRAAVYASDQPQNWGDALYVRRDME